MLKRLERRAREQAPRATVLRTLDSIRAAGFDVREVEQTVVPKAPRFVRPLIVGAAESA